MSRALRLDPSYRALPARTAVVGTGVLAAVGLALSLRIQPGNPWFYPATLALAAVYVLGSLLSVHIAGRRPAWHADRASVRDAVLGGAVLAVVFVAGAFAVRFLPFLSEPVHHLLDHARVGRLAPVLLTTAVNGIAEEVFYRGVLWRVVTPRYRLAATTVLYTAVTSLAGVPLLAFAAAVLGLLAGVLRERSGSITPPIIAHLVWSLSMLVVLPYVV